MFYGWVVVGALALMGVLSVALAGPIMSFFIPVMHTELGIPLLYFGLAMSSRQLGFALMSPFLGRWIDRYGARPMLLVVGISAGLLVYSLSFVTSGWHLIAIMGLLGVIGLQGAGGELYGSVVIAKWFQANRGRALSIAFIGMPLGMFFLTPLTQHWIDTIGWQVVWQIFGVTGGVLLIVVAILIKPAPEIDTTRVETDDSAQDQIPYMWTRAEALRSATFWRLSVSFGILMFTISTVAMFRVQHFFDQGLDPQWVAIAFSTEALISASIAIPIGLLIEHFRIHYLTAIGFSFAILMLALTIYSNSLPIMFMSTAAFGMGAASVIILQNTIWPAYFGSLHIGAIRGVAMPVTLAFAVLGAPAAGMVRDMTGSFIPIWWATMVAMLLAIGLILMTPKPEVPISSGSVG
jgi:predicted MFS family arabinose efflux permease